MSPNTVREMSPDEWDTSADLWLMMHNAERIDGDRRRFKLFGPAVCRAYWCELLPDSQRIIEELEDVLDRPEYEAALHQLCGRANSVVRLVPPNETLRVAAAKAVCYAAIGSPWGTDSYFTELDATIAPHFRDLLRDIFGNPFRPVAFAPEWRTASVVAMAEAMYAARAFDRMPVLADALEEAGCTHPDVLAHCRGDGRHVRGCWVVDLVLGKA